MAAKKSSKRSVSVAPRGFKKVETHLAGFWKPEIPGQSIQGIVGEAVEVRGKDDKINTFYTLKLSDDHGGPIMTMDNKKVQIESGMMVGIGGKMLLIFLRGREGKEVYITYAGLGPKKPGQNAPKMFETFESISEE